MKKKQFLSFIICLFISTTGLENAICFSAEEPEQLQIICNAGLLTIKAVQVKPEDLFIKLGRECNIDIISHGDVFPDQEVSVHFEDKPVKKGVKTLVQTCAIKNYLMDFQRDSESSLRLAKVDLFTSGSGQRIFSRAQDALPRKFTKEESIRSETETRPSDADSRIKAEIKRRRSFTATSDFRWDGSAPIAFPEFKGALPYEQSTHEWDESAKSFSEQTMDLVPPAVRDIVAELIITTSDDIARERGADIITQEISSVALIRIGKRFNLPPNVMKNMPRKTDDFSKGRISIEPEHLEKQYH